MTWVIHHGDWIERLKEMPDESVHCCVTSPPYWGLRDYGVLGQLGLERTPEEYVAKMIAGFREVRRVLRADGTCWINLGDSYAGSGKGQNGNGEHCTNPIYKQATNGGSITGGLPTFSKSKRIDRGSGRWGGGNMPAVDCKPKDLVGIPWMVAFALRADGWYLRQDIIWAKPNPMPESVTDRCTKSHEYLFLLSKSARYYYDNEAIKELCLDPEDDQRRIQRATLEGKSVPTSERNGIRRAAPEGKSTPTAGLVAYAEKVRKSVKVPGGWDRSEGAHGTIHRNGRTSAEYQEAEVSPYRNKRSVWEIATSPFPEAHFATFPPKLVEPCILAGCSEGGTVLDPFSGAGTTGLVATRLHRNFIGIELNADYIAMANRRIEQDAPLFNVQNEQVFPFTESQQ